MPKSVTNIAASVRQRLLQLARKRGADFQLILIQYAVAPAAEMLDYPVLLDHPAPRLLAYPRETVAAEKFQSMVELGMANSRMKDFFDIWVLALMFAFDGSRLAQGIRATFERRRTPLPVAPPLALTEEFYVDRPKQVQWEAFLRKGRLKIQEKEFGKVAALLRDFLMPPTLALAQGQKFSERWPAGGPWRTAEERGSGVF